MEVDLQDLLVASRQLGMMADVYDEVTGKLAAAASGDAAAFEADSVYTAWVALRDRLWTYAADSQDNLNACSRTMVRYINAVCATESENVDQLRTAVSSFNNNLAAVEEEFGANVDNPLPAPDPSNPNQVIDEPAFEPADRP